MSLDPTLLTLLACPLDHGPLVYVREQQVLYNPRLRRSYAVVDDVPVLLPSAAMTTTDAEHDRLTRAAVAP